MSDILDISKLKISSKEATFEVYAGFGQWVPIEIKKEPNRSGVISMTDYEGALEDAGVDNEEVFYAMEELVDGLLKVLSSTLNIIEEEEELEE